MVAELLDIKRMSNSDEIGIKKKKKQENALPWVPSKENVSRRN